MFRLSPAAVKEFQQLHKQKFGTPISPEEAERDLTKLMRLVSITQPTKNYKTEAK